MKDAGSDRRTERIVFPDAASPGISADLVSGIAQDRFTTMPNQQDGPAVRPVLTAGLYRNSLPDDRAVARHAAAWCASGMTMIAVHVVFSACKDRTATRQGESR